MNGTLPGYTNLNEDELECADHCAEIGDFYGLKKFRELNATRDKNKNNHGSNTGDIDE